MSERTVVLLHGAGTGAWVWERVQAAMRAPSLALDLPERERRTTPDNCAARIQHEIESARLNDVVVVAHSMAGVLVPALARRLGPRLKHVVYVAAIVPRAGHSLLDTIGFPGKYILRILFALNRSGLRPTASMIRAQLCNDLSDPDAAHVVARYGPEFAGLYVNAVDAPARVPSTYVRLSRDASVPPKLQTAMAAQLDTVTVVDIAAGHLAMWSKPDELAAVLDRVATSDH